MLFLETWSWTPCSGAQWSDWDLCGGHKRREVSSFIRIMMQSHIFGSGQVLLVEIAFLRWFGHNMVQRSSTSDSMHHLAADHATRDSRAKHFTSFFEQGLNTDCPACHADVQMPHPVLLLSCYSTGFGIWSLSIAMLAWWTSTLAGCPL